MSEQENNQEITKKNLKKLIFFYYNGVAEYEYRDGNTLWATWCPRWPVSTSSPRVSRKINDKFRQDSLIKGFPGRRTRM
ncbi:hypothetical protein TSAR_015347 [Trichomalopsis sarcophagae]|uniref:Uncharacterized protein n=1 Tax=Trichomalopsis sarcophagae TaxID=543379 RepID=A0A232ENE0_9HYME|nr:hypothetical protein TSAR_015347 [Trichomalopsis sarcophagae]